jgi:REP element-mobilizing transposase RayT
MTRPLRLEFAGALYHVTARGDRREEIYLDDEDRVGYLELLGEVCARFNWTVHAYCLMTNHYHLIVETPDGNLSIGMRQLNGVYTLRLNRRHRRVGHVFQGRYHAVLVQKESYLLELTRYVVLNPVRAGIVARAGHWRWSSYQAMVGETPAPGWLETDWLLAQFGSRRSDAIERYARFVNEGLSATSPWESLKHQAILGDEAFVAKFRDPARLEQLSEIPKTQRRPLSGELVAYRAEYPRDEAMARAYLCGAYTMKEIADFFDVHYMTVSRAVRKHEQQRMLECET